MACSISLGKATMFFLFIFVFCFPSMVLSESFNSIQLPATARGPESIAFELGTERFYTTVADGRILQYNGPAGGFRDFGFTSPNRIGFFYLKMVRTNSIAATIFSTFIILPVVLSVSFYKIQLPPNATGPEALAFELGTGRFYTGVTDGRILKYKGRVAGFVDFGFAAPNRSKSSCDGNANPNPACGRALGMALHHATKKLYVCDAFYGFGVLGPEGGLVTQLSTGAEGEPYRFCNAVDVHQRSENVYFTDASAVYDIRQLEAAIRNNDSTGRLLKFDSKTKQVTVLYKNLSGAVGVAVNEQETFVLVSEFIANRTRKIWLQDPKAETSQVINRQPTPDNIKRTTAGSFWLAAAMVNQRTQSIVPIGQRINAFGTVLQTVNLEQWYGNTSISEVQQYGVQLYVASRLVDFVGVVNLIS